MVMNTPVDRSVTDHSEFAGFTRRVIKAHARRVASGDVEALVELVELEDAVNAAMVAAVTGLRGIGYSWAEIASRLGVSKQAVWKRWGRKIL